MHRLNLKNMLISVYKSSQTHLDLNQQCKKKKIEKKPNSQLKEVHYLKYLIN